MAQLMTINLNRGEAPNLGFRLQGGTDFAAPLVIQKVNGGSPAERAGLVAGDAVIKINNTDVFNLRHKDAQDVIIKAGPAFSVTVQRGGCTWKPSVIPTGALSHGSVSPVTKTSLAAKPQASIGAIGTGHNVAAKPFLNGTANGGPKLVNKQYNSPIGIYSDKSIAETLSAQSEVLSTGVLGVNFKKNEKNYDATKSAVYHMLQESENEPRDQEQPDVLDSGVVSSPVGGFIGLKHVQAPETRPTPPTPQLPPGQNICADCERLIVGVFVRIKDKNLHVECFKCSTCGCSLKNVGYYNINNKLYCDIHAKLAAKSNPPAPNLVPVTLPPSSRPPAGTISAALSCHPLPSPAPLSPRIGGPASPSTNITAAPFQSPKVPPDELDFNDNIKELPFEAKLLKSLTLAAARKSNATPETLVVHDANKANYLNNISVRPYTQFVNKASFSSAPRPFSSVNAPLSPNSYSKPLPRTPIAAPQSAPAPALSSTPEKGRSVQNIVWPPVQEEPELPTACPLYFPPPSQVHVAEYCRSRESYEVKSKESYDYEASLLTDQTDRDISDLEDYTSIIRAMEPKMSLCSSEVCNITGRRSAFECVESLAETLQTQMLVDNILKDRPKSPPPLNSDVLLKKSETVTFEGKHHDVRSVCSSVCDKSCCNDKCDTCPLREPAELKRPNDYQNQKTIQNAVPHKYETPMLCALKTMPDSFAQIPQKHSTSALASALSIAPSEPFHPVPSVYTTLEHVPLPEETVPYFPPEHPIIPAEPKPPKKEIEQPSSPLVEALKVAPDRPFTPIGGPRPVVKKKPKEDPLFKDLPKPQEKMSMLAALTTAPDRSYSPLVPDLVDVQKPQVEEERKEEITKRRQSSIKQPNPQPFISSMVNTFEVPDGKEELPHFPPVSIELQQSSDYHADYEQVKSEISSQIIEQSETIQKREDFASCKIENRQVKEERCIARQAEEVVYKKPLSLASSLHKSEYIPQYQTSLQYDEEIQLPHHKNINKLLNPGKNKSKSEHLLQPQPQHGIQTPPPQIVKPAPSQHDNQTPQITKHATFQPVHDDFQPPNSAFSQRVARPLTPSMINKPPSAIPYYQQNLVATEFLAPDVNLYDPKSPAVSRSPSPCPGVERSASPFRRASPRPKSPAPGPPPNPLRKHESTSSLQQDFKVEKAKDSITNYIPHHRVKYQQILKTEGSEYDDQKSLSELSEIRSASAGDNFRQDTYQARAFHSEDSQKHEVRQMGNVSMSISEKAKLEQLQQLNKWQTESTETSADSRVQIQRKKTVTEEFEHMHKEKVIEIEKGAKHPFQKVNVPMIEEQGIIGLHVTNPQPLNSPFLRQSQNVERSSGLVQAQGTMEKTGSSCKSQPVNQTLSNLQPHAQIVTKPHPLQSQAQALPNPQSFQTRSQTLTKPQAQFLPKPVAPLSHPSKFTIPVPPVAASTSSRSVKPNVPIPPVGPGSSGRQAGGNVFAPKRGRGVLNMGGMAGTRVPLCGSCHQQIRGPFITALGKIWCPDHFVCATPSCKRPLQDIGFVEEQGQLHCEYCFERYLAPDCSKCNSKIKGDCLKAIGKNFHPECFNCAYCGKLFGNSPFFLEDGMPYCETDWNEMFTTKCFACGFPVEAGDRWVEALNNNYHTQCFNCTMCKKNLEGQSFFAKGGRPFCKNHAR